MKKCKMCEQQLPLEQFKKHKLTKDKLNIWCNSCQAAYQKEWVKQNPDKANWRKRNPEQSIKTRRVWESNNPEKVRGCWIKQYWPDLTGNEAIVEYQKLFDKQKGLCAICNTPENNKRKRLAVDHDHSTGKVRGLLCDRCNRGLGYFKDSPELLHKGINYLRSAN